ncbi:MAG: hypothetical protein NTY23_12880, partial [Chloroflexi bacterium]|nr:hypothetical protein [Chloroflexota bacterium]
RRANRISIHKLNPRSDKSRVGTAQWDEAFAVSQIDIKAEHDFKLNVHTNPRQAQLFDKLELGKVRLGEITESSQGIILYKTAEDAERAEHTGTKERKGWKRLLRGKNIGRYETKWGGEYVNYGPWLWCPRDEKYFASPKILLQAMRNKSLERRLVATLDVDEHYNAHNLANIIAKPELQYDLRYVLGLFNSRLLNYWYKAHFPNVNINPNDFRQLPIHPINFSDPTDKTRHDRIVALVEEMLDLHARKADAKDATEQARIQRLIDATDKQIDALVYELYDLTPEEIAIVESGTACPSSRCSETDA